MCLPVRDAVKRLSSGALPTVYRPHRHSYRYSKFSRQKRIRDVFVPRHYADSGRLVASLDRKRLGADCWGGAGSRTEAFSIRRLGGSRWRLRRTRCAMGFERQRGSERGLGRAAKRGGNAARIVGMVLKMSQGVCGEWPERRWRGGGHTSAPACGSTSPGRQWWTRYEESK